MAEAVVFSLGSKIMSAIASPAFQKAYEVGLSIWEARDELAKLQVTMETIQAVLLDAEKKQRGSVAVKNWIKRLKGVLYDAEDFFDEVAIDDLLKQQMMEGNQKFSLKKQVRVSCLVSCSRLNPIVSRNSIAKKVKSIRKSLLEISIDMGQFEFVRGQHEDPVSNVKIGKDPGCYVDPKFVFGRDEDKKVILDMLVNKSNDTQQNVPAVIVIVGIGGMGKTTLAQLIYNDEEVKKNFEKKWFACISDTTDEKEILGKIFQSICENSYSDLNISQLQTRIRGSIEGAKFLLVIDDVWDEDHGRWQHRMSLLGGGAKGSRIVVTTRSSSVAKAVDAYETHTLGGLSEDDSWELFKKVAFTHDKMNDPRWIDLGREIVKKCARVPLAIRSIGSILYTKTTIREWESFKDKELSEIEEHCGQDHIMSVLKLSYDHLASNMKQCFAYCSLFPKDFVFDVPVLIYHWIAQGYIKTEDGKSIEEVGHSYFMDLLRRSLFQESEEDDYGEIKSCKMHDLVHDLAIYVAGEETVILTKPSFEYHSARHVNVVCGPNRKGEILPQVQNMNRLRTFVLRAYGWDVDQQLKRCKWLRALDLSRTGMEDVPSCIGELKLLRYLGLPENNFESLPDSVTNLLSLLALDLRCCYNLKALPANFRKLVNLRRLNITGCHNLQYMPGGFGELSSLQYLSDFVIGGKTSEEEEEEDVNVEMSGLDALSGLQLRGCLIIKFRFDGEARKGYGDNCWQLPISLERVEIRNYPGTRMKLWDNNVPWQLNKVVSIKLCECKVKYLPSLRLLPYLRRLYLMHMPELEYIEEEEVEKESVNSSVFFPCLEILELEDMSALRGWSKRTVQQQLLCFPVLSWLKIWVCAQLEYMPSLCNLQYMPSLLHLASPNLRFASIWGCHSLTQVQIEASPNLQDVIISQCASVTQLHIEAPTPSLSSLTLDNCPELKDLHIVHPDSLEILKIINCPQLRICTSSINWDSLLNIRRLELDPLPPLEELPQCLLHRQALGHLRISAWDWRWRTIAFRVITFLNLKQEEGGKHEIVKHSLCPITSTSSMSSLVGAGDNLWVGLYVISSIVGFFVLLWMLDAFYINPYGIITWWYKGLLMMGCMTASILIFGGFIIMLWHFWGGTSSSSSEQPQNVKDEFIEQKDASHHSYINRSSTIHYGCRPDFRDVFGTTGDRWGQVDIGVLVCGPSSLQSSVAKEIRSHNLQRR